ncbi:MAG: DUF2156 domain-containing protein [Firmicutes bacterium]|nr:DUF2156 domain-containing protein [Bacillota bacterium]
MDFFSNRITIDRKEEIEDYINRYAHETSGLTFSSLYLWRDVNDFTFEVISNFLCVAGLSNFEGFEDEPFVFPLLPLKGECDAKNMRRALDAVTDRFAQLDKPYVMRLIPKHMIQSYIDLIPAQFLFLTDRANYDYVYRTEDLAGLKGRRYHSKKNLVNRFNREQEGRYEIVPFSADMAEEALSLLEYIDEKKQVTGFEADMLHMEKGVLMDALPEYRRLGLEGVALRIDGKLEGYAIGGLLGSDTIVEHVEKANVDFPGIYQKLNQEFAKACLGRYEFINREEDMGLAGLRKAKTSYRPCRMIEKSIAVFADDTEAIERYGIDEEPLE